MKTWKNTLVTSSDALVTSSDALLLVAMPQTIAWTDRRSSLAQLFAALQLSGFALLL